MSKRKNGNGTVKRPPRRTTAPIGRCYESHPPLPLKVKGTEYTVTGGSCLIAPPMDVTIFVGLDGGMVNTRRSFPWTEGQQVWFPIPDRGVPSPVRDFIALVEYLGKMLQRGERIHVGCIGGHGRTGMLFAALVAHLKITEEAVQYVRENYCEKAVESQAQVEFLAQHFGVAPAIPTDQLRRMRTAPPRDFQQDLLPWDELDDLKSAPKPRPKPKAPLTVVAGKIKPSAPPPREVLKVKPKSSVLSLFKEGLMKSLTNH